MKKTFILFLCNLCYLFVLGNEPSTSFSSGLTIDNISSTNASCIADDGTATVETSGGVPPLTYVWENIANTGTVISSTNPATGLASGAYRVRVSDADACAALDTVIVGAPPSPTILVIDSTSVLPTCGNSDGSIGLIVDGLEPLTYNWEDILNPGMSVSTDNPAINLPVGMYSVTITGNNGCTTIASANLLEAGAPTLDNIISETSTCGQANGVTVVTAIGGTIPYTYNWENSNAPGVSVSTFQVASDLSEGTYHVTVTDVNGCTVSGTTTVGGTPPLNFSILGGSDPTCLGANDGVVTARIQGGSSQYAYLWSTGSTQSTVSELPIGTYTLTVTDTDSCTITGEVELTASESIFFDATSTSACAGANNGTITVQNVTGGVTPYSYSADGVSYFADNILTDLSPGIYDIFVKDDNECVGTAQVEISAVESPSFETSSINATCSSLSDGSITILNVSGGNPPYVYALGGSSYSSDNIFNDLSAGLYDVYVQDNNNCVTLANQLVENATELVLDYGEDIEMDYGEVVNLFPMTNFSLDTALYRWEWGQDTSLIFNDLPYNPTIEPTTTTTYNVTVTDKSNDCYVSDAINVRVNVKRQVFIPNIFSPNLDGDNDIFTVFGGIGVARINTFQVFNRWGAKMHEASNFSPGDSSMGWDGTYRGNPAAQGVYVYYVEVEFVNGTLDTYRGDVTIVR